MVEEKRPKDPIDPFSIRGLWCILKKRYPVVLAFLVLGGSASFFLAEKEKGRSDEGVEKRYSFYFIGSFTEREELGMLLLKRGKALVDDEERRNEVGQLPEIFEDPESFELEPGANGHFSLYYRSSSHFTKQQLVQATKELLALDILSGEKKEKLFPDFELLVSKGVQQREKRVGKKDSLLRVRGHVVILIMSFMLGLFVSSVLERQRSAA